MRNKKNYKVLGIMTGTSMDGLDCSLVNTNGINYCKIIEEYQFDYNIRYKNKLKKLINNLPKTKNKRILYANINEVFITKEIIRIIKIFLKKIKYKKKNIDLIGFSGQTIFHDPKNKYSLQLGSGQKIYKKLKIPVITNFRDNDINNNGQGAPIGCFYHKYLIEKINRKSVILNIGGVSNITSIIGNKLIGFDSGPGNSLIDDLFYYYFNKRFDKNGKYAKKGHLIESIYSEYKKNSYFNKRFPKSLDRNHFNKYLIKLKKYKNYNAIHTASMMSVYAIIKSLELLNPKINEVILTGGGRKNLFILNKLKTSLKTKEIHVNLIDKYGLNGDLIEAQMFAFLAVRSINKLPISSPLTTGVKKAISGGILYK